MSTIQINTGNIDSLEEIAALFNQYRIFYEAESDLPKARNFIKERISNSESVIFTAVEDGKSIGFVQLYPTFSSVSAKPILVLNDLFVMPDARMKGVGKALILKSMEYAKAKGYIRLSLSTAHDNPAQKLYESLGFIESTFKYYDYSIS